MNSTPFPFHAYPTPEILAAVRQNPAPPTGPPVSVAPPVLLTLPPPSAWKRDTVLAAGLTPRTSVTEVCPNGALEVLARGDGQPGCLSADRIALKICPIRTFTTLRPSLERSPLNNGNVVLRCDYVSDVPARGTI